MSSFMKKHGLLIINHVIALLLIVAAFFAYKAIKNAVQRKAAEEIYNVAGDIVRIEYRFPGVRDTAVTERPEDIEVMLECMELARMNLRTVVPHIAMVGAGPDITFTYADGSTISHYYTIWVSEEYPDPFRAFEEIPYIAEQLSAPAD